MTRHPDNLCAICQDTSNLETLELVCQKCKKEYASELDQGWIQFVIQEESTRRKSNTRHSRNVAPDTIKHDQSLEFKNTEIENPADNLQGEVKVQGDFALQLVEDLGEMIAIGDTLRKSKVWGFNDQNPRKDFCAVALGIWAVQNMQADHTNFNKIPAKRRAEASNALKSPQFLTDFYNRWRKDNGLKPVSVSRFEYHVTQAKRIIAANRIKH